MYIHMLSLLPDPILFWGSTSAAAAAASSSSLHVSLAQFAAKVWFPQTILIHSNQDAFANAMQCIVSHIGFALLLG